MITVFVQKTVDWLGNKLQPSAYKKNLAPQLLRFGINSVLKILK